MPSRLSSSRYSLKPDYRGMVWDLMLYVPTVVALGLIAGSFWYQHNTALAYLLVFLACFFLFAGANRIFTRLLWLPNAPVAIETAPETATLIQKNGQLTILLRDLRLFRDRSGRSFGLTGMTGEGARRQYVFHRGQFIQESDFEAVMNSYSAATSSPGKS